ncbi:hypothetical protein PRIPAC_83484 [Pristionchus pacificus]|uniref:Tr-type G domain-containing protein n=1 Tax=Pristionchus pacificus TaxID=54126 RepID=A0A2A6BS59_PRIPA|nr:hypothetical protein PRIPAC_83484 [Pristionchus pacificus]|eukprot:PDM68656.1 hypothetical protein PRIPAC_46958 [Pristionchus pacificus]
MCRTRGPIRFTSFQTIGYTSLTSLTMSRHRNFQNMNYDDERDDFEDDEFGRSYEDEISMSPSCSEFMYRRPRLNTHNQLVGGTTLNDFIPEEADPDELPNDVVDDEDLFQMDDVQASTVSHAPAPPSSSSAHPPPPAAFFPPPGLPPPSMANLPADKIATTNEELAAKAAKPFTPVRGAGKEPKPLLPNVSSLRVSEKKHLKESIEGSCGSSCSRHTHGHLFVPQAAGERDSLNLVVVGHVDAGKSTLMGHLLCQLGCVDQRTMHKYKQESARSGKASFAFAWVLDETEEERSRGVTMDIARTTFETDRYRVVLLDAPGHKDFIPNMITGASQADAALLVANATRGEFETGFENGGQTREHAMLLRALGVSQLVVAVNKMDTVEWSRQRYSEVESALRAFLAKQAGFSAVRFVPVSGLAGDNLVKRVDKGHPLAAWQTNGPLRCIINDVLKATPQQLVVTAKVESGEIEAGEKVFIMPNADAAVVKAVANDSGREGASDGVCGTGEQALMTLTGAFEPDTIHVGHVVVRGGKDTLIPGRRFVARIVVFDVLVPLMRGTKAELFAHSLCEPCTIVKLTAVVNKANGEVIKNNPRCLTRQQSGRVAIEAFTACRALGRITLRAGGQTIAAGIIEEKKAYLVPKKKEKCTETLSVI